MSAKSEIEDFFLSFNGIKGDRDWFIDPKYEDVEFGFQVYQTYNDIDKKVFTELDTRLIQHEKLLASEASFCLDPGGNVFFIDGNHTVFYLAIDDDSPKVELINGLDNFFAALVRSPSFN